jgi:hypothetical protein
LKIALDRVFNNINSLKLKRRKAHEKQSIYF